jgi:hypothetical protein
MPLHASRWLLRADGVQLLAKSRLTPTRGWKTGRFYYYFLNVVDSGKEVTIPTVQPWGR